MIGKIRNHSIKLEYMLRRSARGTSALKISKGRSKVGRHCSILCLACLHRELRDRGDRTRPAGETNDPKHNLTWSHTLTWRVSPRPARPPAAPDPSARRQRPAAPAKAWSESSGPGPRDRKLRLVLAAGLSVPHLRPDWQGSRPPGPECQYPACGLTDTARSPGSGSEAPH